MAEVSLEARVGRLERENRRLRVGMVAVLAVVVALAVGFTAVFLGASPGWSAVSYEVYVTQQGDTPALVAARAGVKAADLCTWNKVNANELFEAGRSLIIYRGEPDPVPGLDEDEGARMGLARVKSPAPSSLCIGTIAGSAMQVTIHGIRVPAYTVNGATCVFVSDLTRCKFSLVRNRANRVIVGPAAKETGTAVSPAPTSGQTRITGKVTFPSSRLFISNRQIPAYEYDGRLLMQIYDLRVLGTLDTDPITKQIVFTAGQDWQDPYGFVFNFAEPTEDDSDIAPHPDGRVRWQYVYIKGIFGAKELVIADRKMDDNIDGVHWLVGQILSAKCTGEAYETAWLMNPRLVETRLYVTSPSVASYLRIVASARVSMLLSIYDREAAREAAAKKAARREALKKNGYRPLKITNYSIEDDELGIPVVRTTVLNLSNKTADAFDLDLYCYDTFGRPVNLGKAGNRQRTLYQDSIPSWYQVTIYIKLYARDVTTRVHPALTRVHFTDGSVWAAESSRSQARRRRR